LARAKDLFEALTFGPILEATRKIVVFFQGYQI